MRKAPESADAQGCPVRRCAVLAGMRGREGEATLRSVCVLLAGAWTQGEGIVASLPRTGPGRAACWWREAAAIDDVPPGQTLCRRLRESRDSPLRWPRLLHGASS